MDHDPGLKAGHSPRLGCWAVVQWEQCLIY
jgi:hypothetical protein